MVLVWGHLLHPSLSCLHLTFCMFLPQHQHVFRRSVKIPLIPKHGSSRGMKMEGKDETTAEERPVKPFDLSKAGEMLLQCFYVSTQCGVISSAWTWCSIRSEQWNPLIVWFEFLFVLMQQNLTVGKPAGSSTLIFHISLSLHASGLSPALSLSPDRYSRLLHIQMSLMLIVCHQRYIPNKKETVSKHHMLSKSQRHFVS